MFFSMIVFDMDGPDSRPYVRRLGGKVRIKKLVHNLLGDTAGVIGDGYDRCKSFRKRLYRNPGVFNTILDQCVTGVQQDIQEGMGIFIRMAVNLRVTFRLESNVDVLVMEALFDERACMPDTSG